MASLPRKALTVLPLAILPLFAACSTDTVTAPTPPSPIPSQPAPALEPEVDLTAALLSNKDLARALGEPWVPTSGSKRVKPSQVDPTVTPLAISPVKCASALPLTNTWTPATITGLDQLSQAEKVSVRESSEPSLTSWSTTVRLTPSTDHLTSFLAQTTLADSSCTGSRVVTLQGESFHKPSQDLATARLLCLPGELHLTEQVGPVLVHTNLTYPLTSNLSPDQLKQVVTQYNRTMSELAAEVGQSRTALDLDLFDAACTTSLAQGEFVDEVASDLWDRPEPPPIG